MTTQRGIIAFGIVLFALLALGPWLPQWATFLATISLGKGFVVLGLLVLLRAGLVSFGHGLFYCVGAYTAGLAAQSWGFSEALTSMAAGAGAAALLAALLGFLLAGYRGIFFGLLNMAFAMILYGVIVKSAALGSTDGFTLAAPTLLGMKLGGWTRYAMLALASVAAFAAAWRLARYTETPFGRLAPAIRDNEIRVEYLGQSVRNAVHVKYVISAALAGLGGAITALTVGHVDPEMAYWTTSGEFVFVAILSGSGSVVAPFLGALIFEVIRTFAYEASPNTWQMVLGIAMLLVIVFLPDGLWSMFRKRAAT
jgi:ABC-type branched-subunit amino acid transport system permease subunit